MLNRARHAILPAAALAAFGVTAWVDSLSGIDTDRDGLLPAMLTIVLSVAALLDYQFRKFWRDTRKAKFENAVASIAEGVRAEMHGRIAGDEKGAPGPRKSS